MIKPIWALAGVALLTTAGVAGALVVASPGGDEEVAQQVATPTRLLLDKQSVTPALPPLTPGPGVTLWRWGNLTVLIPDGSGISASPGAVDYPGKLLHFLIGKVDPKDSRISSTVVLDSETGAIVEEQVLDQHREEMDRVLATLTVSAFDRTTAPWPYNGEPTPDLAQEVVGGIGYLSPPPATGLYVGWGLGDPGGLFIHIRNERSVAFVQKNPVTGELTLDTALVLEEDRSIFERWLATIKPCDAETAC